MQPPIIVAEERDLMIFETVAAAELSIEGPDVLLEIYEVFDATGLRLTLSTAGGPQDYSAKVTLTEPAVHQVQSDRLRNLLREHLEFIGGLLHMMCRSRRFSPRLSPATGMTPKLNHGCLTCVAADGGALVQSGDFWELWTKIAGPDSDSVPVDQMDPAELDAFNEMYELVYMGQPDSANAAHRRDGLIGGNELRDALSWWLQRLPR